MELSEIFEAFRQQSEQLPHYGGTGLGLSISRKLLEMMNGSLSVESTLGKGTAGEGLGLGGWPCL